MVTHLGDGRVYMGQLYSHLKGVGRSVPFYGWRPFYRHTSAETLLSLSGQSAAPMDLWDVSSDE